MKPLNPNSLRNALASHTTGPHPEADLLNSFAEGTLLAHERSEIVNHLAMCETCRSAIALAADAAPARAIEPDPAWRRHPSIGIAVPAFSVAAVAVLTFLVMYHNPRPNDRAAAVSPQAPQLQTPAASVTSAVPASAAAVKSQAYGAPPQEKRVPSASSVNPAAAPRPEPIPGTPPITTAQGEAAPSQLQSAPAPPQQTLDVQAEISAAPSPSSPPSRHEPAASLGGIKADLPAGAFANRATSQALAKASVTAIARPHWRINRQGQPERAFGSGTWQAVLPAGTAPVRVLATSGADVWTGGDNAHVYHSSDNGQTWSKVVLPEKNGATHSIAHIQIDSPTNITIEAADGTKWTTSNGGASWK